MAYDWQSLMRKLQLGQDIDLGFTKDDYQQRFADDKMTLSKYRLIVIGRSDRHIFDLYAFNPDPFVDDPQHYISPCYRFIMIRHRGLDGLLPTCDQYHVFYRGKAIDPTRWAIRTKQRDPKARQTARDKRFSPKD